MDECEVCAGENGPPVGWVTFDVNRIGFAVRSCGACLTAILQTMADQWNGPIGDPNAAVAAIRMMLGIEETPAAPAEGCER